MPRLKCPECNQNFPVLFPPDLSGTRNSNIVEGGTIIICPRCGHKFSLSSTDRLKYESELENSLIVILAILFFLVTILFISYYLF